MRRQAPLPAQVTTAALLAASLGVAAIIASRANWDLRTMAMLLVFAVARDQMAMRIRSSRVQVSGSFLAIVVAVVLLGGTPAAVIALITIAIGGLRGPDARRFLLPNLANYATFPIVAGLVFHSVRHGLGLDPGDTAFGFLVFGLFVFALLMNFLMVAAYTRYTEGHSIREMARRALVPLLISDMVAAVLAVGVSEVALHYGVG